MIFEKLMSVPDLPERLRDESRPIFLYGTGNGADKILDAMSMYEIPCEGVFASDGFVRDRTFRGMKVRSYSDTVSEYGDDIVILCAFGSPREEVLSFLGELGRRHTLYIPEVPLFCRSLADELFTADYAAAHRNEIEKAYAPLKEESRCLEIASDNVYSIFRKTNEMKSDLAWKREWEAKVREKARQEQVRQEQRVRQPKRKKRSYDMSL